MIEGGLDLQPSCRRGRPVRVQGVVDDGPEVDGFSMVETTLAASQGQERVDELGLVLARIDGLLAGSSERVEADVRVGQGYLKERLAEHERGAQLVGGVGDEAPLGVE